jgi:hypothetical protein
VSLRTACVLLLLVAASPAAAAPAHPWWQQFYTRVGIRDVSGIHAWAGASFGLGYRLERGAWGIDGSVLNLQYDPAEGLHTLARIGPYLDFRHFVPVDLWFGAALSYGWCKGTVDEPIPRRTGRGAQLDFLLGYELPPLLRIRSFLQLALTAPLYRLYDTYRSSDSPVYVVAYEAAVGLRF